jgi:leader peptidase (prepilin peptidase)/N-methyltransferase
LAAVLLAGLGLIVGSFLNVVIYRVPLGLSIIRPGSACPTCHAPITARDNIPLVSWLLLRRRCRHCHEPISVRYPAVELLTGIVWVSLGWWCVQSAARLPLLPLLLVLGSAAVALTLIDIEHHRLPDAIVLPLYPITLVGLLFAGVLSGVWNWSGALIGAACWLLPIGGLWFFSGGRGMGMGDVKLAPVLGATLGWIGVGSALVGLLAAFVLGGLVGAFLLIGRRAGRGTQIPFGPYLLAGAAVGLAVGEPLWAAYLGSMGL